MHAQNQPFGKPNNLKVLGGIKPNNINRIAKID
jgi:hypothetical protein